jgi:hypothetical protein
MQGRKLNLTNNIFTSCLVFVFIYKDVSLLFMPKYLVFRDMDLCRNYKIYLLFLSIAVHSRILDA